MPVVQKKSLWGAVLTDRRYDQGYGPNVGVIHPDKLNGMRGGLASLRDASTGEYVDLWAYDIVTNISLAGSTAQSRGRRAFYAHNFVQTSYTVSCQAPSE